MCVCVVADREGRLGSRSGRRFIVPYFRGLAEDLRRRRLFYNASSFDARWAWTMLGPRLQHPVRTPRLVAPVVRPLASDARNPFLRFHRPRRHRRGLLLLLLWVRRTSSSPPFCLPLLRVYDKNSFSDRTYLTHNHLPEPRGRQHTLRGDHGPVRRVEGDHKLSSTPRQPSDTATPASKLSDRDVVRGRTLIARRGTPSRSRAAARRGRGGSRPRRRPGW